MRGDRFHGPDQALHMFGGGAQPDRGPQRLAVRRLGATRRPEQLSVQEFVDLTNYVGAELERLQAEKNS